MKNILRVFKNDLNKIHNNVIAMIVIMGILVIPTLYCSQLGSVWQYGWPENCRGQRGCRVYK